jgi:hypothetical protein
MGIGSLRQGAQRVSQNSGNKGGGGKGGYFNKLRVPKLTPELQSILRPNELPGDPIMLVQPETPYDDIYAVDDNGNWTGQREAALHILTHQVQVFKNGRESYAEFTCTAGPNRHAPQNCVGCQQNDAGNKSVANSRQHWAFNIKHLVPYHEVPLMDRQTNTIRYKKDKPNEPVMVLEACRNGTPSERLYAMKNRKQCEHCQRGIPPIYGAPKVFVLGKSHLEELLRVDTHLEQTCANCMTRLIKMAYACARCDADLLDLSQTQMTNEQVREYASIPQQCRCGNAALPKPIYDCGWDPSGAYKLPHGGCPGNVDPRPLSIFDVVFSVHKEGESTQSKLVISPSTPIQHFRTITGNADLPQWLQMQHLQRNFDLKDMYKAQSLDEQAKLCNVPNPFSQQQPQYQQYGAQQPQQGYAPAPQYGMVQQPQAPMAPPYGAPVPGYPPAQPQQPQWQQYNGSQVPQQGGGNMQQQPAFPPQQPGMPFNGRPNFNK